MTKGNVKRFIEKNEELLMNISEDLNANYLNGDTEMGEYLLGLYSEVSKQHLNGLKQLADIELGEENLVLEYEKLNIENENLINQRKQELNVEIMNASKDMVMQILSMIFYTARFREGLRFDVDNYVNDGFVKGLVQRLPDFMKSRK